MDQGSLVGLHCHLQLLRHIGHGPVHGLPHRSGSEALKLKDGGPAQDCVKHVKIRILRGGRDQRDLAVFNMLQKSLLLLFVEGLNLVQIEQYPVWGQHGVQLRNNRLDVRRGGRRGVELKELSIRLLGDDICHGCLAGPRGTVEDQVRHRAGVDNPAQDSPFAQNMILAVDLG